jgi:NTP pyrophosphatase (non-canonical NTP hydrolase)
MTSPSDAPLAADQSDFDRYQHDAARTLNPALSHDERTLDAAAGLAEEAGEVLAHIRKHLFQKRPLDRNQLRAELGDALWCLAAVATTMEISLGDVAQSNLAKLHDRYPHGFAPSPNTDPPDR